MADKQDKATNETHFHGPVSGPIHTGSGPQINAGLSEASNIRRIAKDAIVGHEEASSVSVGVNTQGEVVVVEPETSKVIEKLPQRMALERIAAAASENLKQLNQTYEQIRSQSKQWTVFSLIAAILGLLIVSAGVIMMIAGYIPAGAVTTAVSAISEITAFLFFRQSAQANERVDTVRIKLTEAEGIQRAMDFISTTPTDEETQNRLIETIVLRMLGLSSKGQEITPADSSKLTKENDDASKQKAI